VHYGRITLPEITDAGDIDLHGTTVKGSIDVSGEVTIFLSICKDVETNKSITALCSTIQSLDATSIAVVACQIGQLRATKAITAIACRQLGSVSTAGGTVALFHVKKVARVCGKDIFLNHTAVQDDVIATRNVDISDSTIGGTLCCAPDCPLVVIRNSTINKIVFNLKLFKKFDIHQKISRSPIPSLKLINCKVRDIIFRGGEGKVIRSGSSVITGKVSVIKYRY
jgi:hypothetical protein